MIEPSGRTLRERTRPLLGLALLCAVQTFVSWWWMRSNGFLERPPTIEQAYYRERALDLLLVLQHDGVFAWAKACVTHAEFRTLLFPAAASVVSACAGNAGDGILPVHMWLTVAAFALVFTIAAYRLARNFGSPRFALLVTAVTLCCPVVVAYQRPFYPQFPMKGFALLALDLLVRSRGFSRRRASVGFAGAAALATMCKVIAPLYFGGAALAAAWSGLRDPARRAAAARNLGLATAVGGVLLLPWQAHALPEVLLYTKGATDDSLALRQMAPLASVERWTYYASHLWKDGFGAPLALLVGASVIVALWRRRPSEAGLTLAAAAIVCLPVLTYGQAAAQSQYVIIFVPLGILLLATTIARTPNARVRVAAIVATAAGAVFGLSMALRSPSHDESGFAVGPIPVVCRVDWFITDLPRQRVLVESPTPEHWPIREVARAMFEHSSSERPRVATTHMYLCASNLEYEARLVGRSIEEVVPNWGALLKPGADWSFVTRLDFLVIDTHDFPIDGVRAVLDYLGLRSRTILQSEVGADSTIYLLRIEHP